MNKKEIGRGETDIVVVENDQTVVVKEQKYMVAYTDWKSILLPTSKNTSTISTEPMINSPLTKRYSLPKADLSVSSQTVSRLRIWWS